MTCEILTLSIHCNTVSLSCISSLFIRQLYLNFHFRTFACRNKIGNIQYTLILYASNHQPFHLCQIGNIQNNLFCIEKLFSPLHLCQIGNIQNLKGYIFTQLLQFLLSYDFRYCHSLLQNIYFVLMHKVATNLYISF